MRRGARDRAEVRIVWRGGATTELTVMMPVNALAALPDQAKLERRICELATAGIYDDEIARILTAEGYCSARRVDEVLPSTIRGVRLRHRIKAVWRCETWMREQRARLSRGNDVAKAMDYMFKRWSAFTRFLEDGRICLSNNAAERAAWHRFAPEVLAVLRLRSWR